MTKKDKVEKVMREWKAGTLTSNGKQVTDYDQAVAIALSEAGLSKYDEGGEFEDAEDFIEDVKEMHEAIDYVVLKDGTKIEGEKLMKEGGNVIEKRYVNKDEDYETRYAKDKPMRKGYNDERMFAEGGGIKKYYDVFYSIKGGGSMIAKNIEASSEEEAKEKLGKQMRASSTFDKPIAVIQKFAVGGEIGNTVTFSRYGERTTGRVTDKLRNGYEVVTDEGTILVEPQEVISFSDEPIAKKKRFGFFADGGEIENKIEKLKKVVSSKMINETAREKARVLLAKLEKQLHESKETKAEEKEEHKAGLWKDKKDKIKVGDFVSFDGGYEGIVVAIRNNIHDLKFRLASGEYVDKRRTKSQLSPSKLSVITNDMKEAVEHLLHESKETKAEEKAEHEAGGSEARLDEKEELNATIQKLYDIEAKAEDLINYQSGGIQGQSVDKIKKYVEYVNKEASKLNVPFGSEVYDVLEDENAHSLNLTLGLLGFYKNAKDSGEWAKKHEQYAKVIEVVNEVKGGGSEAKAKPELKKITQEEWNTKKKHDYASIKDGQKYILTNVNGVTVLVPVEIIKSEAKKPTTRKEKVSPEDIRHKLKEGYSYSWTSAEIGEPNKIELFGFTIYDENGKDVFKSSMIYDDLKQVKLAVNNRLSKIIPTPSKPKTRKAPVKKAVAKKAEVKKEVEAPAKPKADHKKLVAKLKAKKGGKEYDNRASLVPFTDKRRERSESSDKKRSALPPGKRVSENGVTYYENRLNRTDLSKKDKFEKGGEVKGSDWSLNLNW